VPTLHELDQQPVPHGIDDGVTGTWFAFIRRSPRHTARMTARTGRIVAAVLVGLVPLLLGAGTPAGEPGAIVIEPDHVDRGARDVTLVFRLTDVEPDAPSVRFQLFLPTGRPLVGVTAPPAPGWTAELTTTELPAPAPSADGPVQEVVSDVTWTATEPATGEVSFPLHVDLMPEGAGPVRFRAALADASGRTVEWADSWSEGGPKPAHETLELALGGPPQQFVVIPHSHDHGGGTALAAPGGATPTAIALTVGGLLGVGAVLAALVAVLARRQQRRFEAVAEGERDGDLR
jgi:hypothetical protein